MTVSMILAAIAGFLALLSMIPQLATYPVLSVSALLLSIAVYLGGK